jgi:hypothetical protein
LWTTIWWILLFTRTKCRTLPNFIQLNFFPKKYIFYNMCRPDNFVTVHWWKFIAEATRKHARTYKGYLNLVSNTEQKMSSPSMKCGTLTFVRLIFFCLKRVVNCWLSCVKMPFWKGLLIALFQSRFYQYFQDPHLHYEGFLLYYDRSRLLLLSSFSSTYN